MMELRQAEELKSKLLFSIIVLSFRSVHKIVSELKQRVFTILQIPGGSTPSEHVAELQRSVESYLSQCHDNYNMAGICEDVMSQICSTLFDHPSIRQCAQLRGADIHLACAPQRRPGPQQGCGGHLSIQ